MNQIYILSALTVLVSLASARPRFLVIPLEDVEFLSQPEPSSLTRVRRDSQDLQPQQMLVSESEIQGLGLIPRPSEPRPNRRIPIIERREDQIQIESAEQRQQPQFVPTSFIGAINSAGIPRIEDSLTAGSSHRPSSGPDYVDYGAYTGKKGAFGWYSDHPVLLKGHH